MATKYCIINDLKNFLSSKSTQQDRVNILNFLYGGKKFYKANKGKPTLDKKIKKAIFSDIKNSLFTDYIDKIDSKSPADNIKLKKWYKLVLKINQCYKNYLHEVALIDSFKYVVFSEAPMLTFSKNLRCQYIFDQDEDSTIYRSVPFQAFTNSTDSTPKANDLIKAFKDNKVLFIDLIPIPLPTIDTKIRENWSKNDDWIIEQDLPLPLTLLKQSFESCTKRLEEIRKKDISFCEDLKIILMMPPKTAMGILDPIALNPTKITPYLPNKLRKYAKSLIRVNEINSKLISPELNNLSLRQFRQIATGSSNYPCLKHFKHAMK